MATLYGDNHQKNFVDVPTTKSEPGQQRGEMRMSEDFFTADAVAPAADVIMMQRIPEGARIVDVHVFNLAGGTPVGGAADIGWTASEDKLLSGSQVGLSPEAEDADGFFAAASLAGTDVVKLSELAAVTPGFGKKFGADVFLKLTITTDTVATDGSKLGVRVFYVED